MRAESIGHFKPCISEIYLHIDARMADHIRTHPYVGSAHTRVGVFCRAWLAAAMPTHAGPAVLVWLTVRGAGEWSTIPPFLSAISKPCMTEIYLQFWCEHYRLYASARECRKGP